MPKNDISFLEILSRLPIKEQDRLFQIFQENPDFIQGFIDHVSQKRQAFQDGDEAALERIVQKERGMIVKQLDALKAETIKAEAGL